MIDTSWNDAWNKLDRVNEDLLQEQETELQAPVSAEEQVYHFYSSLPDLVNSLRTGTIYSNKNEQASQRDKHAARNRADLSDDESYVCFTSGDGEKTVPANLGRPFGLTISKDT